MSDLGTTLKQARTRAGLSLREVERLTGIQNAHLSQIETGQIARPEMAMLWDLAAQYGLDYSELVRLAGYGDDDTSARQRQRTTAALRALGRLTPSEQAAALKYMAELRSRRGA